MLYRGAWIDALLVVSSTGSKTIKRESFLDKISRPQQLKRLRNLLEDIHIHIRFKDSDSLLFKDDGINSSWKREQQSTGSPGTETFYS